MTNLSIGFSKNSNRYYLWHNQEVSCNGCHKSILEPQFILNTVYNRLFKCVEQYPYCHFCYAKVKRRLEGAHTLVLIPDINCSEELIPVIPDTLLSKNHQEYKGSTFGACILSDEELASETCKIDTSRCKVAFDPNRNIQVDFVSNHTERIAELDSEVKSVDDAKAILQGLMDAKPVLPCSKKDDKLLEEKKEEVD